MAQKPDIHAVYFQAKPNSILAATAMTSYMVEYSIVTLPSNP